MESENLVISTTIKDYTKETDHKGSILRVVGMDEKCGDEELLSQLRKLNRKLDDEDELDVKYHVMTSSL